jgi:hypothetical protein
MKKTLHRNVQIISAFLVFFTSLLQAKPVDITKDFFKDKCHPGIYAFSEKFTALGGKPAERIELKVDAQHRKQGLGSALLTYALSKCTGNCTETRLVAITPSGNNEDYLKLEKFYKNHGGVSQATTRGAFVFKPKQELSL